ncbi:sensor histidine kinase [Anaerosacchariphilus polymeriproducens]|uniref:histidine kinase n=1 Tax=Anaerosacchariphilus polymeriproducens TaxID=1812858 RepID=A0A371ARQ2_9FIRM|nr:HAMP domain-containing sensor histidine kinase [Anaerosacchariphilus polymeriproducens]RDU22234.1 GHKL domain-containing protein [Anaerosacchariphilus polymeriproducens]
MKLKTKISIVFLLSISMSVIIFMFSVYYILHSGYFSGVTENEMQNALHTVKQQLYQEEKTDWTKDNIKRELMEAENNFFNMRFAVLSAKNEWISVSRIPTIGSVSELLDSFEQKNQDTSQYRVIGSGFEMNGSEHFLICFVKNSDFEAMSYSFNLARGHGILGKIAVFGFIITVIITGLCMFLFSRRTMRRLYKMYDILSEFTLDKADVRMNTDAQDELAIMAGKFNCMAEKIQFQYEEKKRYEQNRKELVSNISHDLRTPLSSILGYSEMLRDGIYETEEEQKKYTDIIHRKAIYMDKLLKELLEYSKVDLGTLVLNKQKFDIAELIREILIEYYMIIEKNQYELQIQFPNEQMIVNWDRERISRVLRNLIENALKYGMDGEKIRLTLSKDDVFAKIEIQDYGAGMSEKVAERIFERFYRGDTARNSKAGGMGLGMYIANEIIQKHNGNISITSVEGQGTLVQFVLPINEV